MLSKNDQLQQLKATNESLTSDAARKDREIEMLRRQLKIEEESRKTQENEILELRKRLEECDDIALQMRQMMINESQND